MGFTQDLIDYERKQKIQKQKLDIELHKSEILKLRIEIKKLRAAKKLEKLLRLYLKKHKSNIHKI